MEQFCTTHFLVVGRAGMDLYADPPGTEIENAVRFQAMVGGSAANIAVGITRLGGSADLLTAVSDDAVGRFVCSQLQKFGVGTHLIETEGGELRTSLGIVETRAQDCQSVIYRNGAADLAMSTARTGKLDLSGYGGLVITGTVFATEPSRAAGFAVIASARATGLPVILDVDYRPYSWTSMAEASATYRAAAAACEIVIGNDEEFSVMAGIGEDGQHYARQLAQRDGKTIVYKQGHKGAWTYRDDLAFETGVFPTTAIKPTGAGDSFLAGFVVALATGSTLEHSVRRGAAAAALVVSRIGCSEAMPSMAEIDSVLSNGKA